MIHDAVVEVTCDRKEGNCHESVFVSMNFVYRNLSPSSGFYDHDTTKIEKKLTEDHEWTVCDGKHFCSSECAGHPG